jgi:hypothetical protein
MLAIWRVAVIAMMILASTGKVMIVEPARLKGDIQYSVSSFGFVDYQAKKLVEVRLWSNADGCDPPTDDILEKPGQNIGYLMKKGECSYRRQALNAHRAGAYVVITYTDEDGESHLTTPSANDEDSRDTVLPPVMMISKKHGVDIRSALESGEKVRLSVDFDIITIDPPVNVFLFYSAVDYNSIDIYNSLIKFHISSSHSNHSSTSKHHNKEIMNLEPIPRLYTRKDFNLSLNDQSRYCIDGIDLCVNPHPSAFLRDATDEIRVAGFLLCLYQNLLDGDKKENLQELIKILDDYRDLLKIQMKNKGILDAKEHFHSYFSKESSFMKKSVSCYKSSLGEDKINLKGSFEFLEKVTQKEGSFIKIPSMFILDNHVKGDLTGMTAVSAVCDVLPHKYKPEECYSIEEVLSKQADKLLHSPSGPSRLTLISSLGVIFCIACLLIGLVYLVSTSIIKTRVRADIMTEIDTSLERYYQIQNTKLETVSRDSELMANNV